MTNPHPIDAWHRLLSERDLERLDEWLAEDVVFHSPVVHAPQRGKALAKMYLAAASMVLAVEGFHYVRQIIGERDAALEFVVTLDQIEVNGVDLIHWNGDGRVDDFKVMLRPLKAIEAVRRRMAELLEASGPA